MSNFDLIEYQKRVIADLTAENKALKDQIHGMCIFCKHDALSLQDYPCSKCFNREYWEWKGVDGK